MELVLAYLLGLLVTATAGMGMYWNLEETERHQKQTRRYGARVLLLLPVWPVWFLVFVWYVLMNIGKGLRTLWKEAR